MTDPNRRQLLDTAHALGEICNELVFLGGSIVGLLITDTGSQPVRPTEDVDVIVEVTSRIAYQQLAVQIQNKGFQPDPKGPICRYVCGGLVIDVMPLDESILGFSNRWYPSAMKEFRMLALNAQISIKVVTAPVFIATKLEAYKARGQNDPMMSHDLEDILLVIEGRKELLDEIQIAPLEVQEFLMQEFKELWETVFFDDLIAGTFQVNRGNIVRDRIAAISGQK